MIGLGLAFAFAALSGFAMGAWWRGSLHEAEQQGAASGGALGMLNAVDAVLVSGDLDRVRIEVIRLRAIAERLGQ